MDSTNAGILVSGVPQKLHIPGGLRRGSTGIGLALCLLAVVKQPFSLSFHAYLNNVGQQEPFHILCVSEPNISF